MLIGVYFLNDRHRAQELQYLKISVFTVGVARSELCWVLLEGPSKLNVNMQINKNCGTQ